jgi:hypothetical protein
MKKLILLLLISLALYAKGQEYVSSPKLKAKDLVVSQAIISHGYTYGTLSDFRILAPNSPILAQDLTGFQQHGLYTNNVSAALSGMLGLAIFSKKRNDYIPNCTLRIGLQGSASTQIYQHLNKEIVVPIDTLYSVETQTTVYIDSVYNQSLGMYKSATNIVADISLVYNSHEEKRFQIHGGLGLQIGSSIASHTNIDEFKYETTRIYAQGTNYSTTSNHSVKSDYIFESYRNKSGFVTTVYFPLGYNFRLSNKKEFLKNIYLFGEFRPLIHFENIPELFNILNTGINGTFGIRFSFAKKVINK